METLEGWDYTSEQMATIRAAAAQSLSILDLVIEISKQVEPAFGDSYTHKAICPSPQHKQGSERTPSFYLSEETKTFHCWGCGIKGDVFDLLSRKLGRPADEVVLDLVKNNGLDAINLGLKPKPSIDISELNLKLSVMFRDHLASFKGAEKYNSEKIWVDLIFQKIDERIVHLEPTNITEVQGFYKQMIIELDRRKGSSI